MDICVGLPRSVNDFHVLKKYRLHINVQYMGACLTWLLDHKRPFYLCGDKGYALLLWLMTLHKEKREVHSILELLYHHKHKKGQSVVENAFGVMKQTFIMI